MKGWLLISMVVVCFAGCKDGPGKEPTAEAKEAPVPMINFAVIKSFPHDTSAFTQGLLVHEGRLWESTGSPDHLPHARTVIGWPDTVTGKLAIKQELDRKQYFGEGITILHNKLYQLTYQNQLCFVYSLPALERTGTFSFSSREGWGLTNDGRQLIMSDGTDTLTFLSPEGFTPVKRLTVTQSGLKRDSLNELEFINGYVYANVWLSDRIVKIDTATGKVVGQLDLGSLTYEARHRNHQAMELNGIAWDSASGKVYVTGKLWPAIYQVAFPY